MLTIAILQGPDKGHSFDVDHSDILIGRDSPDIPISDNTVSRRHAQLKETNGSWRIKDLNSANGTWVNGVKVAGSMTSQVKQGDQIRCGTSLLVIGGVRTSSVPGEPGTSLRIDADGNIVESAIMTTVPSLDDSVIIAGPDASDAVGNLRLLYEFSNAITSIFDPQQLLEKVMDMIFDNFPADRGFILLRPEEHAELEPVIARYRTREHSGQITVSHTIVNHVVSQNQGVICSNAMRDPRFAKGKSVHDFAIHSALCVPITARDRNIGVIYVDTKVATHTYVAEQLRLLTAVGFQAGLALEHARLYQAGVQAERLAAAGETVAYLSHGIKNLLQSLQSAADMVELGLSKNKVDVAGKGWTILQRNLNRVQNLVLNMLAFSKVRQPNLVLTQINQLITETTEMIVAQADEKHVGLISDLENDLPAVPLDPDGLQQVILNLMLNAIDAVEPAKGVVTIKTAYDSTNHDLTLTVSDNGKGIPQQHLSHIFDAFHSSKGQKGTGLGLAVVKKVVEEHKGSVSVNSSPKEGTTFNIRIPTTGGPAPDSESTRGPG